MASEPATSKAPTLGDSKTMHASRGAVPFAEVSNTRPAKTSASQERTWDIETTSIKLRVESNARLAGTSPPLGRHETDGKQSASGRISPHCDRR